MKGIMMAVGLFVLSMGVSLGLVYYISFEQLRLDTNFALKQALSETMIQLKAFDLNNRNQQAFIFFINNFSLRKHASIHYQIDLMGFIPDPLALRIQIKAYDLKSLFELSVSVEETMIEVNNEIE